jgi:hypothetical protein
MKTDILKKLIKEAVREVFQEEMKEILLEAVRSPKTVVTETVQPMKTNIPVDIKRNLRSMIGGEFDTTVTANSSMIQPAYTPPPVNTVGEGSSLPDGEVNLNQIMNLMNR